MEIKNTYIYFKFRHYTFLEEHKLHPVYKRLESQLILKSLGAIITLNVSKQDSQILWKTYENQPQKAALNVCERFYIKRKKTLKEKYQTIV